MSESTCCKEILEARITELTTSVAHWRDVAFAFKERCLTLESEVGRWSDRALRAEKRVGELSETLVCERSRNGNT